MQNLLKALVGNAGIYPPVIGATQRAAETAETAANLKLAADAAVAGRNYEVLRFAHTARRRGFGFVPCD